LEAGDYATVGSDATLSLTEASVNFIEGDSALILSYNDQYYKGDAGKWLIV
jgi:hypothetical protein